MWILVKLGCKWTAACPRLALIGLAEASVWGERKSKRKRGGRVRLCYLLRSFLNIISQVGLGSGSSIPAANGKIKGLWCVWSQRVEAAKWTPCSGFHAMSTFLSPPHQSGAAQEHELLSVTWGLIGPLIPYQMCAHFSGSEPAECPCSVTVSKHSVDAWHTPEPFKSQPSFSDGGRHAEGHVMVASVDRLSPWQDVEQEERTKWHTKGI